MGNGEVLETIRIVNGASEEPDEGIGGVGVIISADNYMEVNGYEIDGCLSKSE